MVLQLYMIIYTGPKQRITTFLSRGKGLVLPDFRGIVSFPCEQSSNFPALAAAMNHYLPFLPISLTCPDPPRQVNYMIVLSLWTTYRCWHVVQVS
jgi:hypothetical protein